MSLPIDAAPPSRLPPAATAPWPLQPPPHGASAHEIAVRPVEREQDPMRWIGALVGAAAAGAIGLAVALPLVLARRSRSPRKRSDRAKA